MRSMKDPSELANNSADASTESEASDESPPSSRSAYPEVPPLALRCDGRVLVATTDLKDVDLTGRERWEGIVLTEAEAADVFDRMDFEQAASPTVASLIARDKKAKKATKATSDDDSGDDE